MSYVLMCYSVYVVFVVFFIFKQTTADDVLISDWVSDVGSSDLLARQNAHRGLSPGGEKAEKQPDDDENPRLMQCAECNADCPPEGQKSDADSQQEQEQAARRDRRPFQDVCGLLPRQFEQEDLKDQKKRSERGNRDRYAPGCRSDLIDQVPAHDRIMPMIRMATIGPIEAKPRRPKPSDSADRPASTAPRHIVTASNTGEEQTQVVPLPAS